MKQTKYKFYIWFVCTIVGISICWQLLERLIYKEIQPRTVDNIISLFWSGAIYFAYNFKEIEFKRMLRKYDKVYINTWWLRKPIPSEMLSTGYISDRLVWLQSCYEHEAQEKGSVNGY